MTSQLILGNGFGVAVASDQAVTIGNRVRTYENAKKIHPLADPHRLAVLQSGHVGLCGMPVGVLLEDWKNSLGTQQRTVEGYRDNFLTWLQDNLNDWTTSTERDGLAWWSLDADLEELWDDVQTEVGPGREEKSQADLQEEVLRFVREANRKLLEYPIFEHELEAMADEIFDRLSQEGADGRPMLSERVDYWFDDPGSDEISQEVHRYLRLQVGRTINFPNRTSTFLAFTGYGANDLLPHWSGVYLYGAIGNHVCRNLWPMQKARRRGSSYAMVHPFGQREMIDQVLYGWDRKFAEDAAEATFEHIAGQERKPVDPPNPTGGDDILGEHGNAEDQDEAASTKEDWRATLMEKSTDLAWKRRGEPALRTIASLPLSSLADAAGSLVSIQNLSQNIHGELPTVGGYIDVATITKGEGFQWVSRQNDD